MEWMERVKERPRTRWEEVLETLTQNQNKSTKMYAENKEVCSSCSVQLTGNGMAILLQKSI